MKLVFFLILINTFLFSNVNTCKVDKKILYAILLNEGLSGNKTYSYIISFNNDVDAKRVQKTQLKSFFINNRVLDCKNEKLCSLIVRNLDKAGITNLDLGAFQINYKFHSLPISNYFDINKSYLYACSFVEENIKKFGYNWYAIASYHSQTPYYNQKYQKNLIANYKKIVNNINKK